MVRIVPPKPQNKFLNRNETTILLATCSNLLCDFLSGKFESFRDVGGINRHNEDESNLSEEKNDAN